MLHVEVAGHRLAYEIVGQGRPVVLLAGWGSDHHTWDVQVPALAERCQLILLDNRGMGESSPLQGACSTLDMAHDVGAVLEHLDLPPALLVGHSMGGMIAQHVARLYPQRVRALQLVCSAARSSPRLNYILATWARSCELDSNLLLEVMLSWIFTGRFLGNPAFLALAQAAYQPPALATLQAQCQAIREHQTVTGLSLPTLVVTGEEDIVTTPDDTTVLVEGIRGARLEVLSNCGHACMVEAGEAFNESLLRFEGVVAADRQLGFRKR